MHYNTTHQVSPIINRLRVQSEAQEAKILAFFESNPKTNYTPSEVCQFVFENSIPVTSVRRAITVLTNDRNLVKTTTQRDGPYGRPEYAWQIATGQFELML